MAKQSSSSSSSTKTTRAKRGLLNQHPADAQWARHRSPRQVIGLYDLALNAAELRHKASRSVTRTMCEAFLALRQHGVDFTELAGYQSDGCPERPGPAHGSEADGLKSTLRWAANMRRQIRAEVHRRTVGVAVLVHHSNVEDHQAPSLDGGGTEATEHEVRRRRTRKPLALVWDRSSPPPSGPTQ